MEKLTLQQSTIMGTVHGKSVLSTVRASTPGLLLPAGQYLLHPPVDNPVYGPVMAIQPLPPSAGAPAYMELKAPTPASGFYKTSAPAALKDSQMRAPAALKYSPMRAPAVYKFTSPAIKFDSPSIKFDGPSIKFDRGAVGASQPVVLTTRPIAGDGLFVTTGLGDLFDAVARAGGVILVVE